MFTPPSAPTFQHSFPIYLTAMRKIAVITKGHREAVAFKFAVGLSK
jgi:hypothetical protein